MNRINDLNIGLDGQPGKRATHAFHAMTKILSTMSSY